jgi:chromosome segregation ATPase
VVYLIAQVFVSLLLAGLIGLFAGWLIWGLVVRRLKNEVAEFESRLRVLMPLPARLIENEAKYKESLAAKEAQAGSLAQQLKGLQVFQDKAVNLARTLAEREGELTRVITAMQILENKMQSAVTAKDEAIEESRDRYQKLEAAHTAELADRDAREIGLSTRLQDLDARHRAVAAQKDSQVAELMEVVERKETEATKLRGSLQQIETQHKEVLAEKDHHAALLMSRIQELLPLKDRVTDAGTLLQTKDAQVAMAQVRLRDQDAQLNEASELMRSKEAEASELRSKIEDLEAQNRAMAEAHEARTRAIEPLRNALNEKDREAARLVAEFEAIHARNEAVLAQKETDITRLTGLMEELAARHEALIRPIEVLESWSGVPLPMQAVAAAAGVGASTTGAFATVLNNSDVVHTASREAGSSSRDFEFENLKKQVSDQQGELNRLREMAEVLMQPPPHDEVVRVAHSYAAARNFQGGSEKEDWLRAENEVRIRLATKLQAELEEIA